MFLLLNGKLLVIPFLIAAYLTSITLMSHYDLTIPSNDENSHEGGMDCPSEEGHTPPPLERV